MWAFCFDALLSVTSLRRGNRTFFQTWFLYVGLALCLFTILALLANTYQAALYNALLNYLLPKSWHTMAGHLIPFFFESQTKIALASMIISGSLVVSSALLFPLKERCSQRYEKIIDPKNASQELPLTIQALEEGKLLIFYGAAQSLILGLGYYPYTITQVLSSGLSLLFLFFAFGIDFIAPTLQRHQIRYSTLIKLLLKHWPTTLLFGALYSTPVLLIGHWVLKAANLTLLEIASLLFIANIFFMALAIPAGTWLAKQMQPAVTSLPKVAPTAKTLAYACVLLTFAAGVSFHTLVGVSFHHKSQILKCEYDLNWGSLSAQFAGVREAFLGGQSTRLHFDLTLHNPTPFDVRIEKSQLLIQQNDQLISQTSINHLEVASGQTQTQRVEIEAAINLKHLSTLGGLTEGWQVFLIFDILPGIPFVLALT